MLNDKTKTLNQEIQQYLAKVEHGLFPPSTSLPSAQHIYQPVDLTIYNASPQSLEYQTPRYMPRVNQARVMQEADIVRPQWLIHSDFWQESLCGYGTGPTYDEFSPWERIVLKWERIRSRCRRCVLLGETGMGKSWLLYAEGQRTAHEQLARFATHQEASHLLLPIYLHLGRLAKHLVDNTSDIYDTIARLIQHDYQLSDECTFWLSSHLQHGPTLLLLDALDAVEGDDLPVLLQALRYLDRTSQGHIIVTSRYDGYSGFPFERQYYWRQFYPREDFRPLEELEVTGWTPKQVECFIQHWFVDADEQGQQFQQSIDREPVLHQLARVPQSLSWLCTIFSQHHILPRSRHDLYEILLRSSLVSGLQKIQGTILLENLLLILEQMAWLTATQENGWLDIFPKNDLLHLIQQAFLERVPLFADQASWLLDVLEQGGVVVQAETDEGKIPLVQKWYRWASPAFHRLLVASFLAHQPSETYLKLVSVHRQETENWREAIILLASLVDDVLPLLHSLQESREDIATLFLRASCLVECGKASVPQEIIKQVARELLVVARSAHSGQKRKATFLLMQLLGTEVKEIFLDTLRKEESSVAQRCAALWGLGQLGDGEVVDVVMGVLQEKKSPHLALRMATAWTLGQLGASQAAKALLEIVDDQDEHPTLQGAAIWALGQLEETSAVSAVIKKLPRTPKRWKRYNRAAVRATAAWALGQLGEVGRLEGLLQMIKDTKEDNAIQETAMASLIQFGSCVVPALLKILSDPTSKPKVRYTALEILGYVGRTWIWETSPHILVNEQDMITNPNDLPEESLSMIALLVLLVQNRHEKTAIRVEAAEALRRIGYPHLINLIFEVVKNQTMPTQKLYKMIGVMGRIGVAALPAFLEIAQDPKLIQIDIYSEPGSTIDTLDDRKAVQPLLHFVQDRKVKSQMRKSAMEALGRIFKEPIERAFPLSRQEYDEIAALCAQAEETFLCIVQDMSEPPDLRMWAILLLEDLGTKRAAASFLQIIHNTDEPEFLRGRAVSALWVGGPQALDAILLAMHDPTLRGYAISALYKLGDVRAKDTLIEAIHDPELQTGVARALGRIRSAEAGEHLWEIAKTEKGSPFFALHAFGQLDGEWVKERLFSLLDSPQISHALISILGRRGDKVAKKLFDVFQRLAEEELPDGGNEFIRGIIAAELGRLGYADAMEDLLMALWEENAPRSGELRVGVSLGLWIMGFSLLLNTIEGILDKMPSEEGK